VQLDQRPPQRLGELTKPLAPALDDAVVVEDEPLEQPARSGLPRRLQILELDESLLDPTLDLRHAGVPLCTGPTPPTAARISSRVPSGGSSST